MDFYLSKVSLRENPNKREKMIFFVAMIIFSFVFLRSCWYPSFEAMTDVKKEYADSNETLKKLKGTSDSQGLAGMWSGDPVTADRYAGYAASALNVGADASIMKQFSSQSFLKDVELKGISFSDGPKEDGIMTRGFKISLYGPFSSVGGCLNRIAQIPLIMTINSVTMANSPDEEGRVNMNMEGVVYGWK